MASGDLQANLAFPGLRRPGTDPDDGRQLPACHSSGGAYPVRESMVVQVIFAGATQANPELVL